MAKTIKLTYAGKTIAFENIVSVWVWSEPVTSHPQYRGSVVTAVDSKISVSPITPSEIKIFKSWGFGISMVSPYELVGLRQRSRYRPPIVYFNTPAPLRFSVSADTNSAEMNSGIEKPHSD